jgi:hypothetical protein
MTVEDLPGDTGFQPVFEASECRIVQFHPSLTRSHGLEARVTRRS